MKITKKEFIDDVRHEIETLKKEGTLKELRKLNIKKFNADEKANCIYGQMTGSCGSRRAKVLMDKSCVRVVNTLGKIFNHKTFSSLEPNVEPYENKIWYINGSRSYEYISALETYIFLKGAKVKNIIDYLKDETGEVTLKL